MAVLRIVPNLATDMIGPLLEFYRHLFDLELVMDHGWIATLAGGGSARVQLSLATEGGSGTPVPELSIEVDDVDVIYARAKSCGVPIVYPLTDEPWGVRRFYLRDPAGRLINVLSHGV
ncbi:MAG: VOC family protein [Mesorhizobium sp.]